jgi:hypothetical protein
MGTTESFGGLHIEVDSPNIMSGDTIKGNIHLLVKHQTVGTFLQLLLKGTEKTQWSVRRKERDFLGNRRHVTHNYSGKSRIQRQKFDIFKFETGTLQPGQYSFPFEVVTPADLLSSFSYTPPHVPLLDAGPTRALLSYKLVAKIDNPQAQIDKAESLLHVTKPMTDTIAGVSDEMEANISTWCCFKKGTVRVHADFSKTAFLPGETAVVTVQVNNEGSKLATQGVVVSLSRTIRIRDNQAHTITCTDSINSARLDDVIAPGTFTSDSAKQLQLMIPTEASVENACSVHGVLIECLYTLRAEAEMQGWCMCCGDTPMVAKTMVIYPPTVEKPEAPQVEVEWNPKVMPAKQFAAGPSWEYETTPIQ